MMNTYFFIAGILSFVLGVVHSVLGEYLIFSGKRDKGHIVPSQTNKGLREGHLRIIWATWHLASVFGGCIGAILVKISMVRDELNAAFVDLITWATVVAMLVGALLVAMGTKGRHPGWVVLLLIAGLLLLGK